MNVITHIYEDKSEIYPLTQKKHFSESEDEIPEEMLFEMLAEVCYDVPDPKQEKPNKREKPKKKIIKPKCIGEYTEEKTSDEKPNASRKQYAPRSTDWRFCVACYRKFLDSQPLRTAVFSDSNEDIKCDLILE